MPYRSKMCGSEWAGAGVAEMTDRVVIPLLRPPAG